VRRGSRFIVPAAVALALLACGWAGIRFWLEPELAELNAHTRALRLEQSERRIASALAARADDLDATCGDWAEWDSMYAFAVDQDEEFREENFTADSVGGLMCSRIILEDEFGREIARRDYDVAAGAPADFGSADPSREALAAADPRQAVLGLIVGPDGRLSFVAGRPVRRSDSSGDFEGRLLMMRPLIGEEVEKLAIQIGADSIAFHPSGDAAAASPAPEDRIVPLRTELSGFDGAPLGSMITEADCGDLVDRRAQEAGLLRNAALLLFLGWMLCVLCGAWMAWQRIPGGGASPVRGRARVRPVVVVLAGGLVASGLSWKLTDRLMRERADAEFRHEAQEVCDLLEQEIANREAVVGLLAGVLDGQESLSEEEIRSFADRLGSPAADDETFLVLSGSDDPAADAAPQLRARLREAGDSGESWPSSDHRRSPARRRSVCSRSDPSTARIAASGPADGGGRTCGASCSARVRSRRCAARRTGAPPPPA
jgi:hypothetical protein